jgi:prepilin signal peptidase PulO-like enzyme (type II secretory pathway)
MIAEAALGLTFAGLAGAAIGSFLTVVATRLPPLVLESPGGRVRLRPLLKSLSWPGSHCRHCQTPLRWRDNIPLLSFVLLRGRCRACHMPYGSRYVLLEAATALAACGLFFQMGWSFQAALLFCLLAILLALCAVDLEEMLLPDVLVAPLLPLGFLYQTLYGAGMTAALLGAGGGFAALWLIGALYRQSRARDGLGGGDVKLAGALGAWVGVQSLSWFLLGAFATGLIGMGLPILLGRKQAGVPVPFGPFLALSAAVFVLWPDLGNWLSRLIAG